MEQFLHYDVKELKKRKADITASEIEYQPYVWKKLADVLLQKEADIAQFMKKVMSVSSLRIIFTGAGSSAFIGESISLMLQRENGIRSEVIHTTDIVATPESVLYDVPTLLVSYSRSGSSPESIGAIECAKRYISELYNIVIVCNSDSELAKMDTEGGRNLIVNIPQEASDQGFAMTSSVSSMFLATWYVFGSDSEKPACLESIKALADAVEKDLLRLSLQAKEIASNPYERIVYLGFGALRGLAHEGSIKSQELAAGKVVASYDTPTGFRHGPKVIIDPTTVTVHLLSVDSLTRKYDIDLLNELMAEKEGNLTIAVSQNGIPETVKADSVVQYDILPGLEDSELSSYIYGLIFVQLISFEKSLDLGLTPDNPCPDGSVNRVVQGVKIHA